MDQKEPNPDAPKLEAVHARLQEAMAKARDEGFKIRAGDWGLKRYSLDDKPYVWETLNDCLCPMACVIRGTEASGGGVFDPEGDAAAALGIGTGSVMNFIVGFDGAEMDVDEYDEDEFYFLGRQYRKQVEG